MNLPEFSVRNSVFGNMLTVAVLAVGMYAAVTMPRELFPVTDLDLIVVSTVYPNATAEEIESQITIPMEDEIRGVDGIDEFISTSVENYSVIVVTIDSDAENKDRVINDISRKVDRVRDLPSEAEKPEIEVVATESTVIHVCVGGDVSEEKMRVYADRLKVRFEGIPGVSKIEKIGWRDPEIWVEADPRILKEQELSLADIAGSLGKQNVNLPGGKMPDGSKDLILRTVGQFYAAEEIEEVIVRSNADGRHIRVRDVATVTNAFEEDAVLLRANGTRAIMLSVTKKSTGDTIDMADAVKAIVADETTNLPEGIELSVLDFESYVIKRRLKVLLSNGLLGLLLVLFSLPLLLNFRIAAVTALGIPFAFLSAMLVMAYFGISINMMTMFGIILVVGMLVDDAIIIAENIYRHMEKGKSPRDAAIIGATEVMWPVTATVLTTIAAFAPLLFLPGISAKFLKWVPIVVMITLGASLFEALVILPCHIAELARPLRAGNDPGAGNRRGARLSTALRTGYTSFLRKVLHHRLLFFAITLMFFFGSLTLAWRAMRVDVFPAEMIDILFVRVTAPQGNSQEATEELTAEIERTIASTLREGELGNMHSEVGHIRDHHGANVTSGSRYAVIMVYLKPADERKRKAREIIADLRAACARVEGQERVEFQMLKPGPPVGKAVQVKIVGKDLDVADGIAEEIKAFLPGLGCLDIEDDHEPGKQELRVIVDREEAARMGLDVAGIGRTVYTAFQGQEATVIRDAEEETKVRVKLQAPFREKVEYLEGLLVPNKIGRLIELSKVMTLKKERGVTGIHHHDGSRTVTVTAGLDTTNKKVSSTSVNRAVQKAFADVPTRYPGYRLILGGEWEDTAETIAAMIRAFLIALLLIYSILVVQFRSFLQPLVVMTSVPFGLIGVVLALVVHGKPLSMMAMLGMVGMTGVVVNDAIVLVSFINDLRRKGVPTVDAIVEAAGKRVRPILLTSLTTVLGLAPVIYGIGGYEPFVAPAAIVLAYGLVFATFLTLLVLPCMYSLGADLKRVVCGGPRRSRGP